ncbi:MAG: RNA-binding transcriptional accessory protein, partial [Desulfobacula sp.]|nr:RNA-binding transcriptional accessory protein [Desulfobacula sp.]
MEIINHISRDMHLPRAGVFAVSQLLEQGCTIPFIARYRKEKTGSLDEVAITDIRDQIEQLNALNDRKKAIIKSLKERDLLNKTLLADIENTRILTDLEDIYEKYRPKKRTRAQIAKEKGLEPLADFILKQEGHDLLLEAIKYVSVHNRVETIEEAISGAIDIIARIINEDVDVRTSIRKLFLQTALIQSKVKKGKQDEGIKFKDYFDWSEIACKAPSHRILAMFRGQNKSVLLLHVLPDQKKALQIIEKLVIKNQSRSVHLINPTIQSTIKSAIKESYKRLLSKSIEKEYINELKVKAD